jgi:hypothetical protein
MLGRLGRENHPKSNRRRLSPISAYVGPNGGGKSLAMVYDTLPSLRSGRPVLTTVPLCELRRDRTVPHSGLQWRPASNVTDLEDFRQLLEFRAGDVLLDEVTGVASSRESAGLPVQVANWLVQLRRRDVRCRWTSPNWARADVIIREVTQTVTYCHGSFARRAPGREWADNRLFRWRTYDARSFDDFTAHKRETVKPLTRQWFWRPGSTAEAAYDTLRPVALVGVANLAGLCIVCGGKRAHPRCTCQVPIGGVDVEAGELVPLEVVRKSTGRRAAGSRLKEQDLPPRAGVPSYTFGMPS